MLPLCCCDRSEALASAAWRGIPSPISESVSRDVHHGHEHIAEDGDTQRRGVVADGLGDAGGLAVGEPRRAVDRVGAGRPEHEPEPGPGRTMNQHLAAEVERR